MSYLDLVKKEYKIPSQTETERCKQENTNTFCLPKIKIEFISSIVKRLFII